MYDNENKNREHTNTQGTNTQDKNTEYTVNWTTPEPWHGEERQDTGHHNGGRYAQGQNQYGRSYQGGGHTEHSRTQEGPYYRQPEYNGSDGGRRGGTGKGFWAKRIAGITAAAVLFGTVSGGVMAGVNYVGSRYTTASMPSNSQEAAQGVQISQSGGNNGVQASENQGITPVASVNDVSGIVESAMPSIVAINDTMTVEQRDFFGMPQVYQAQSSGSGIIVNQTDTELLIATNNHVVDGATDLKVTFVDTKDVSAAVKGTDSATDLAIIAVQLSDIPADTMSKIKVAALGNSDEIKVGQQVVAIGNALGYGQSVTVGYISALDREIQDENGITRTFIQTDAAINPGNSGGALIDLNGNVIGINAAKTASTEVEGMGFAIPISKAQDILNNLMTKKTRITVQEEDQGYLGIQGTNINAAASQEFGMPVGVYVYKIVEGQAAASSDLKEKDIITKFDGQSVTSMEELKQMLTYYEGGSRITLTVQSLVNGAYVEHEVEITLGSKPVSTN